MTIEMSSHCSQIQVTLLVEEGLPVFSRSRFHGARPRNKTRTLPSTECIRIGMLRLPPSRCVRVERLTSRLVVALPKPVRPGIGPLTKRMEDRIKAYPADSAAFFPLQDVIADWGLSLRGCAALLLPPAMILRYLHLSGGRSWRARPR